jgi:hypothetical protein
MTGPDTGRRAVGDADRWHEGARLRRRHPGWVIAWAAEVAEFRAYRRLPGARRDTAVSAATADGLSAQISQAERPREEAFADGIAPRRSPAAIPLPSGLTPSHPEDTCRDDPPRW